jgi:tetratricopeptide (TPR) repeat protein
MKHRSDIEKAEEMFKRALTTDKNDVDTLCNYAILLMDHRKDIDKAEVMFARALAIDSNHIDALSNYGYLLMNHRKDIDKAQEIFERARAVDPSSEPRLQMVYNKDIDRVETAFEKSGTDEQRLDKALGYLTAITDYIKQIVRESAIMKKLGYDKDKDDDAKLTDIILYNFYSFRYIHNRGKRYLRLSASSRDLTVESDGYYSDALLDGNGNRIRGGADIRAITETHENDIKNIGGRNFKEWVYFILYSNHIISYHYYYYYYYYYYYH